ncbi:hypothetical protein CXG81DRAFT_21398 [Caulochytrium protostelioides]|uniref:Uncharacterized protein n=1 Tax=Caulochytrium protostelioides TaxID=1555241 RepID=A0A4P9WYG2_9FUNG|nr:hypothetical protein CAUPRSCDRAFT_11000 [Caulochytrium protostelioides]RKO98356.1 hypothetical protein CXG81DRAFT_21398 [Caulochytrium protostelioides]|eukprot:RKO98356.1 hypothetical protein CXG81DRAFT_21398 [Caulochytrium protostelioides]
MRIPVGKNIVVDLDHSIIQLDASSFASMIADYTNRVAEELRADDEWKNDIEKQRIAGALKTLFAVVDGEPLAEPSRAAFSPPETDPDTDTPTSDSDAMEISDVVEKLLLSSYKRYAPYKRTRRPDDVSVSRPSKQMKTTSTSKSAEAAPDAEIAPDADVRRAGAKVMAVPSFEPTEPQQKILLALLGKRPSKVIFSIIPTGAGKTLIALIFASLRPQLHVIVVLFLTALILNLERRAQAAGV